MDSTSHTKSLDDLAPELRLSIYGHLFSDLEPVQLYFKRVPAAHKRPGGHFEAGIKVFTSDFGGEENGKLVKTYAALSSQGATFREEAREVFFKKIFHFTDLRGEPGEDLKPVDGMEAVIGLAQHVVVESKEFKGKKTGSITMDLKKGGGEMKLVVEKSSISDDARSVEAVWMDRKSELGKRVFNEVDLQDGFPWEEFERFLVLCKR